MTNNALIFRERNGKDFNLKEMILEIAQVYGIIAQNQDSICAPAYTRATYLAQEVELKEDLQRAKAELERYLSYTAEEKEELYNKELTALYTHRKEFYDKQTVKMNKLIKFKEVFSKWKCPTSLDYIKEYIQGAIVSAEEEYSKKYYQEAYIAELEKISFERYYQIQVKCLKEDIALLETRIKENKIDMENDNSEEIFAELMESLKYIKE